MTEPALNTSRASHPRRFWICGIILLVGALGFGRTLWTENRGSDLVLAKGSFWEARDGEGRLKEIRPATHLFLQKDETIHFVEEGDDRSYKMFTMVGHREKETAFFEVAFQEERGKTLLLKLAPKSAYGILLAWKNPSGSLKRIGLRNDRDFMGPLYKTVAITFRWLNPGMALEINGREVLRSDEDLSPKGDLSLMARGGRVRIEYLHVTGRALHSDGTLHPYTRRSDFSSLPAVPPGPKRLHDLLFASLLLFLLSLYPLSLCLGMPPRKQWAWSVALFFLPNGLYFSASWVKPLPLSFTLIALLFLAGLVMALYVLRGSVRTPARGSLTGKIRAVALPLVFAGLVIGTAGTYQERLHHASLKSENVAISRAPSSAFALEERRLLGPHNALTVEGKYRNIDLRGKVTLEEGAILEIRLRPRTVRIMQGISLFLSADPRFDTGFYFASRNAFELLGRGSGPLPAGTPLEVNVQARGRSFEAYVDGREIAAGRERIFSEGGVVCLTAKGFAAVEGVIVKPVVFEENPVSPLHDLFPVAGALVLFFLAFAGLAALFCRVPMMRSLEASAYGLLPLAYVFLHLDPLGVFGIERAASALLLAGLLFLLFPMVHAGNLTLPRYSILILLVLLGTALLFHHLKKRAWPVDDETAAQLSLADWSGDRLERDLIHLQHPLLRQHNHYLAQHQIRGRTYELEKEPGRTRILCLGTSSTYGYRVATPYPFRLEERLKAEGFDAEVLNGACQGSSGTRVCRLFENSLLAFAPDLVILSLFYNDSYALSQMDEAAYLDRVTAPGYRRSYLDIIKDRLGVWMGAVRLKKWADDFPAGRFDPGEEEGAVYPPVRFEALLRSFARLATDHGIQLVFMKEPVAGGKEQLWKDEFYEAMDRVGREFGLSVVDPTPLLNQRGGARLFMDDVHPYDEGDAVVAEVLYPVIRGLLEKGR